MDDDERMAAGIQGGEATAEEIAKALDDALFNILGSGRMATTWLLVAEVAEDGADRFPSVYESPGASWNEVLGLVTAAQVMMREDFAFEVRRLYRDADDDA